MWITKQEYEELVTALLQVVAALSKTKASRMSSQINTIGLYVDRLKVQMEVESGKD